MKPNALLVNTNRGPVAEETALVEHLHTHPDFRTGFDVFENEPELAPGLAEIENVALVSTMDGPRFEPEKIWQHSQP
jgi:lactate dehydrogenase-like 2-hydroxyacid dehydrogenase